MEVLFRPEFPYTCTPRSRNAGVAELVDDVQDALVSRAHDYMDVGGRTNQETESRMRRIRNEEKVFQGLFFMLRRYVELVLSLFMFLDTWHSAIFWTILIT